MNTRQAAIAIALGIIGLLATSISTQAEPAPVLVWQDNFDSYNPGELGGQGTWSRSGDAGEIKVVANTQSGYTWLGGHVKAVELGNNNGGGITSIALPDTFLNLSSPLGSTRTLTFDIYSPGGGKESVGLVNSVPTAFYGWGDGDSIFDVEGGTAYAFNTHGTYGYDTLGVVGGSAWYTVTETITKYATYMDVSVDLSLDGVSQWNKSFQTTETSIGYKYLTLQSSGGYVYVDNFKAYGQPVPASGTLIIIQ